jgi:3(or 17)beta-hydroxysteroid dehydrogenase
VHNFNGKSVLITGGTRGVGEETARQFAECGATVFITGRNQSLGQSVVSSINQNNINKTVSSKAESLIVDEQKPQKDIKNKFKKKAFFIQQDVSDSNSWQRVIEFINETSGELHILINNAGVHQTKKFSTYTENDFDFNVNTNLKGVFLGCQAMIPLILKSLKKDEWGSIVNVSSIAGIVGTASQVLYSMTKGGLQLFSQSLALEMVGNHQNIRVNCVNPGMIESDMGNELVKELVNTQVFKTKEKAINYLHRQIPMKRFATVREVAQGIRFLASDEASYITGIGMPLDGGLTAG